MKSIYYFVTFTLCLVMALVSCSDDSDIISEKTNQEQTHDFESSEEILQRYATNFSEGESSSQESSRQTRSSIEKSSVNTITLYGYTSKKGGGNKKVLLGQELANAVGLIAGQIYVLEYVTVYQDIKIEGLGSTTFFSTADSPLCGIEPDRTDYKRGYNGSTPDSSGNIRMTTICIIVKSDLAGRTYNKWYPCKPEDVQWNYKLVSL